MHRSIWIYAGRTNTNVLFLTLRFICFHLLQVNSFVGAFHDAVILYALALNETLEANRSISNGTEITRRMWNRTFEGNSCLYWSWEQSCGNLNAISAPAFDQLQFGTRYNVPGITIENCMIRMWMFAVSLPGILVLQELSLRLSIFHFR